MHMHTHTISCFYSTTKSLSLKWFRLGMDIRGWRLLYLCSCRRCQIWTLMNSRRAMWDWYLRTYNTVNWPSISQDHCNTQQKMSTMHRNMLNLSHFDIEYHWLWNVTCIHAIASVWAVIEQLPTIYHHPSKCTQQKLAHAAVTTVMAVPASFWRTFLIHRKC